MPHFLTEYRFLFSFLITHFLPSVPSFDITSLQLILFFFHFALFSLLFSFFLRDSLNRNINFIQTHKPKILQNVLSQPLLNLWVEHFTKFILFGVLYLSIRKFRLWQLPSLQIDELLWRSYSCDHLLPHWNIFLFHLAIIELDDFIFHYQIAWWPFQRILWQKLLDKQVQLLVVFHRYIQDFVVNNRLRKFLYVISDEWRVVRQHLKQDASQRPNVCCQVLGLMVPDLRPGIIWCASLGLPELTL